MEQSYLKHLFNVSQGSPNTFIERTSNGYKVNISHQGALPSNKNSLSIPKQSLIFKAKKYNPNNISLIGGGPNKTIYLESDEYLYIKSRPKQHESILTQIIPEVNSLTLTNDLTSEIGTKTNKTYKLTNDSHGFNINVTKKSIDASNRDLYNRTSTYDPITSRLIKSYKKSHYNGAETIEEETQTHKTIQTTYSDTGLLKVNKNKVTGISHMSYKDKNNYTSYVEKKGNGDYTMHMFSPNGDLMWKKEKTNNTLNKIIFNNDGTLKLSYSKSLLENNHTLEEFENGTQRKMIIKHNGKINQSIFYNSDGSVKISNNTVVNSNSIKK